mmetsp:Transcript_13558/g.25965  ORF Transcript_13558/g.25965 Transcript_13558/m.25965 type:complete len:1142 (+) Transcript_13558:254-3679(+)
MFAMFKETQLNLGLGARPVEEKRKVFMHQPDAHEEMRYQSNHVTTTKYNVVTFLPRSLYEQFTRLGNVYFLLVAVLSTTELSPVAPFTCILPLIAVLTISLVKEGVEDWHRAKSDHAVNRALVLVRREGKFVPKPWMEVRVGELVKVSRNSYFPADLLFLWSANPEGTCHVETMNLDGETNLKIKTAVEPACKLAEEEALKVAGSIEGDPPNNGIYTFNGALTLDNGEVVPLDPCNLLLRGSSLRNTETVLGMVVYTGHQTKVMMNGTTPPSKRSTVERQIDDIILFMFLLLFAMCFVGAFLTATWTSMLGKQMYYLMPWDTETYFDADQPVMVALGHFVTTFILYGYLIPISLYVSIELVKVTQVYFISNDRSMYYPPLNMRMVCRTSNLNEELGMVQTVLSDKTGTLTRNVMELFKVSVAGTMYGQGMTEVERSAVVRSGGVPPAEEVAKVKGFNVRDERLMVGNRAREPNAAVIDDFMHVLALCHTVIPEGEPTEEGMTYQAESPDELAFIISAREYGLFMYKRSATSIFLRERQPDGSLQETEHEILGVLEFNSTRKRMSVIARKKPDGKIWLYCKGADNVIFERLSSKANPFAEQTKEHLKECAQQGLRTLCLAKREVGKKEWAEFEKKFTLARTALDDRPKKLEEVAKLIEKDLELLGATAIEDKLQDGVSETIQKLQTGGINVWVLTGDKMETAINIGAACSLLLDDMMQHVVSVPDGTLAEEAHELVQVQLESKLAAIEKPENAGSTHALIIDGRALAVVLNKEMTQLMMSVGSKCVAVVCCRVSPLQKAEVTALVQREGYKTLAVGDGANDVGMIQEADIGVGISGQEGQQAVMASDFAIAQFRYLDRLILHHGRYNYKRMSKMVTFFFYKNLLLGLTLFYYDGHAFFSGQQVFNDSYMSAYNMVFVAFPIIIVGIWDQDVREEIAAQYPQLYQQGVRNEYFNFNAKAIWMLNGLYQSIVIFYGVVYAFHLNSDRDNGKVQEMWSVGTTMFTCLVLVVNLESALILQYWNRFTHITIWGTIAFWFAFVCGFQYFSESWSLNAYWLYFDVVANSWYSWMVILVITAACLLPSTCCRVLQRTFFPGDHVIVQEIDYHQRHGKANVLNAREQEENPNTYGTGFSTGGQNVSWQNI